jgi:hypothetical protein
VCSALAIVSLLTVASVRAEPPPSTTSDAAPARETAASRFAAGEEAFRRGEHARAGELFEQAHALLPHHDAAWNAAQAWLRAGDDARAATWFARFLVEAPASSSDLDAAKTKLAELAPRLSRIEIHAPRFDAVTVDGAKTTLSVVYVAPGVHAFRARSVVGSAEQTITVVAGQGASVSLEPPAQAASLAAKEAPASSRARERHGPSPLVAVIGGAITAGLAATSVGFGIATERAHDDYVANPSSAAYEDGRTTQSLTNGFFWGAAFAGVVTGALAIFVVDWNKPVFSF